MISAEQKTLIVFGGLPGTGKTTAARALAARVAAVYLRIDTIEQALRRAGIQQVGPAGYAAAEALAAENLALGHAVVADCVNPVRASREAWRLVARLSGAILAEIVLTCSDPGEHRRRVEGRAANILAHVAPDWASVTAHEYEPWDGAGLVLDTAGLTADEVLARCEDYIAVLRNSL
jgi:predicted kinase